MLSRALWLAGILVALVWGTTRLAAQPANTALDSARELRLQAQQAYHQAVTANDLGADTESLKSAVRLAERALLVARRALPSGHVELIRFLNTTAVIYALSERYRDSDQHISEAHELVNRGSAPEGLRWETHWNHSVLHSRAGWSSGGVGSAQHLAAYERDFHLLQGMQEPNVGEAQAILGSSPLEPSFLGPAAGAGYLNDWAARLLIYDNVDSATPLLARALTIAEARLSPTDTLIGSILQNLGAAHAAAGDSSTAVRMYSRAISILQQSRTDQTARVSGLQARVAMLMPGRSDAEVAAVLAERAKQALARGDTASWVEALLDLADHQIMAGNLQGAEATLLNAEKHSAREDEATVEWIKESRATVARARGDAMLAVRLLESVVRPVERATHYDIETYLSLAELYGAAGDTVRALRRLDEALTTMATFAARVARSAGTAGEGGRRAEHNRLRRDAVDLRLLGGRVISLLQIAAADSRLLHRAVALVMGQKGRIAREHVAARAYLTSNPSPRDRGRLAELVGLRSRVSDLTAAGLDEEVAHHAEFARAVKRIEELESELASALSLPPSFPLTIQAVREALPPGTTLLEYVLYRPFDSARPVEPWGAPRYAAFAVRQGHLTDWADLGDADSLDTMARTWLASLSTPTTPDPRDLGRVLYERLVQPLRDAVQGAGHLLVSPDAGLNLLPFAALVEPDGRYLLESRSLSYLSGSANLVLPPNRPRANTPPVAFVDPAFGGEVTAQDEGRRRRGPGDVTGRRWPPLRGTRAEGEAFRALFAGAAVFDSVAANETNLRQLQAPFVLHLGTHGYFNPAQTTTPAAELRSTQEPVTLREQWWTNNPLLRTGIALAGANQVGSNPPEGSTDGVLTALEVLDLDLHGTELVVVSTCQSGVGDASVGEGVHGLRSALEIAGARSQVIALWSVDDERTATLVNRFYTRLSQTGRAAALREAQLALLRSQDAPHPYFWAAFVLSGEWRELPPYTKTGEMRPQRVGLHEAETPTYSLEGAYRGGNTRTGVLGGSLNTTFPRVKWSYPEALSAAESPVVHDGRVYVGFDGGLLVLNAQTGHEVARHPVPGRVFPPVLRDSVAYLSYNAPRGESWIVALGASSGRTLWRVSRQGLAAGPPLVDSGSVFWAAGDGRIYALDAADGRVRWSADVGGRGSAVLVLADTLVCFASSSTAWNKKTRTFDSAGGAGCLDSATGRSRWQIRLAGTPVADAVLADTMLVLSRGTTSLLDGRRYVTTLRTSDGSLMWESPLEGRVAVVESRAPLVAGDTVYAVTNDSRLVALSLHKGERLWVLQTESQVGTSPVKVGTKIVVGTTWDNALAVIDVRTGKEHRVTLDGRVHGTPAVAAGVVYVSTLNGVVYALH